MKIFSFTILSLLATPAFAFLGSAGTSVSQEYACVSLDGVPIQQGTEMAQKCCSNGQLIANAPDSCRAGFNSIGPAAGAGAAYSIDIAQNALNVAQDMNGATTDYTAPTDGGSGSGGSTSGSGSDTNAITGSGSGFGSDSGGTTSGSGSEYTSSGGTSSGSGSGSKGSGGSSAGAGGGDSGLGSLGSGSGSGANGANGAGTTAGALGADKDSRLAYVGGGGKDGVGGANGFGMNGMGGSTSGAGMDKGMNELNLGDANGNRDPNAVANADEDGALGTSEDPADYFKRIDQSANIFKIVSSRYLKKKSLFKVKP
jgi:hypothetical protein